jgi:ABC-type Fe3+ transport system permease subunit
MVGQIATFAYFSFFIVIVPLIGIIENTLMDVATQSETAEESNLQFAHAVSNSNSFSSSIALAPLLINTTTNYEDPNFSFGLAIVMGGSLVARFFYFISILPIKSICTKIH